MRYQDAIELGEECGLSTPTEYIDNVVIHCMNLFVWTEIDKELWELLSDARDNYSIDISPWLRTQDETEDQNDPKENLHT